MDLEVLLPLLGNLGAPLSVSVMLFYLMLKQQQALRESLERALIIIERLATVNLSDCPEVAEPLPLPAALDRLEVAAMEEARDATRPVPMPPARTD